MVGIEPPEITRRDVADQHPVGEVDGAMPAPSIGCERLTFRPLIRGQIIARREVRSGHLVVLLTVQRIRVANDRALVRLGLDGADNPRRADLLGLIAFSAADLTVVVDP